MSNYSKLIAYVIGMAVLLVKQFTGVDLGSDFTDKLVDIVVIILTGFGIVRLENK